MEITFKYKDKIITTPNLEKKLKRMKLSLEDIEIIKAPKKEESSFKWELEGIKKWKYYKHPDSNTIHCCLIDIGTNPSKKELFKNDLERNLMTDDYVNKLKEYFW